MLGLGDIVIPGKVFGIQSFIGLSIVCINPMSLSFFREISTFLGVLVNASVDLNLDHCSSEPQALFLDKYPCVSQYIFVWEMLLRCLAIELV